LEVRGVHVEGGTRVAGDHPFLPVMVTAAHGSSKSGKVKYGLCTQLGFLLGQFIREIIKYNEDMTPEVMKKVPIRPGFEKNHEVDH
jgi:hypothetical protein